MKRKILVSFIGAGNMSKEHILTLQNNKRFILKGIYSRTQNKALNLASNFKQLQNYNSIKELYNKTKSDLVIVSISEEQYKKVMKKILNYPWICLAEKPLGLNFKEITNIYNQTVFKKKKLFVSLNRRFYTSTIALKKIVKLSNAKRHLKIIDCQSRKKYKFGAKKIGIKKSKLAIRNLMYSNSVHLIDYINQFCRGKLVKINQNRKWDNKKPEDLFVRMNFSSGDTAEYRAYWKSFKKWEIQINSNKINLKLKPLERIQNFKRYSKIKKINYKNDLSFKPGLYNQSKEIEKYFDRKKNNLVSLKDYLETVKYIYKIYNI